MQARNFYMHTVNKYEILLLKTGAPFQLEGRRGRVTLTCTVCRVTLAAGINHTGLDVFLSSTCALHLSVFFITKLMCSSEINTVQQAEAVQGWERSSLKGSPSGAVPPSAGTA